MFQPVSPSAEIEYWIRWANWDGGHFLGIATAGYQPLQSVFLPFYPLLIKALSLLGVEYFWSGFFISQLSALVFLIFLYKLALMEWDQEIAQKSILIALIFPTSFYLGTLYSESLFLALTTSAFYFAKKEKWALASLLAGLSFITKIPGIAVIIALFVMYYLKYDRFLAHQDFIKNWIFRFILYLLIAFSLLYLLLPFLGSFKIWGLIGAVDILIFIISPLISVFILGLIIWKLWQYSQKQKILTLPSLFLIGSFLPILIYAYYQTTIPKPVTSLLDSYSAWKLYPTFPWETLRVYSSQFFQGGFFNPGLRGKALNDFLFFASLLAVLIYSIPKLKVYYWVYFLIVLFITPISGTLIGTPRHALTIFPVFFILAQIKNKYLQIFGVILSILLLGLFSIAFINGYWVA